MGIPGFYGRWLSNRMPNAIINGLPELISSVSLDLNGTIHEAWNAVFIKHGKSEMDLRDFILEVFKELGVIILRIVNAMRPIESLLLCVDGVAPAAKMQQQRGRREKSSVINAGSPYDRNAITPGTDLMVELDGFIRNFIIENKLLLPPNVVYSSHLVPGEGEHKIMQFFREGEFVSQKTGNHIVYGLDADLIMLSLLSPVKNIYLSREKINEVISINSVRESLIEYTGKSSAVDDFVIMMFLIGNDFLPHSPAFESMRDAIDKLLEIYSQDDFSFVNGKSIDWFSFGKFLNIISKDEPKFLSQLSTIKTEFPSRFFKESVDRGVFYYEKFRNVWYWNEFSNKGDKSKIEKILKIKLYQQIKQEQVEKMCVNYMKTMEWVYLYYRQGTRAINQGWLYPNYHTPLLMDLNEIIQRQPSTKGFEAYPGMITFNALQQLVAVIPLKSINVIPQELKILYSYGSMIRDFFPSEFIIEVDGKRKKEEGIPIIPFVDRSRIVAATGQLSIARNRRKIWDEQDVLISRLTLGEARERQYALDLIPRENKTFENDNFRGRGNDNFRGRGRGEFQQRNDNFRGRGDFQQRNDNFRGRGDFQPRDQQFPRRGNDNFRGRGDFQPRDQQFPRRGNDNFRGRGEFQQRGGGRGEFQQRNDNFRGGGFQARNQQFQGRGNDNFRGRGNQQFPRGNDNFRGGEQRFVRKEENEQFPIREDQEQNVNREHKNIKNLINKPIQLPFDAKPNMEQTFERISNRPQIELPDLF